MIILGFDHGNTISGFGVVKCEQGKPFEFVDNGFITVPNLPYPETLLVYINMLEDLILKHKPDMIALEAPKSNRGFATHQHLVELLGCAKGLCVKLGIPFSEIPPSTLKLIVAGNGWASKEEVARRVSDHLKVPYDQIVKVTYYTQGLKKGQIKSYLLDGSDALALAITLPIYLKRQGNKLDYAGRKTT